MIQILRLKAKITPSKTSTKQPFTKITKKRETRTGPQNDYIDGRSTSSIVFVLVQHSYPLNLSCSTRNSLAKLHNCTHMFSISVIIRLRVFK